MTTNHQQSNVWDERRQRIARQQKERAQQGIEDAQPKAAPKGGAEWALTIVLITFGALAWLASAKYTLLGWVIGLNTAIVWLGLPVSVPAPAGWFILLAIPLGVVYSRVETRIWHRRSRSLMRAPLFWLGWLIIVATDVGSTYIGVRAPAADAWPITVQVADSAAASFVVSLVLTFTPEWMILGALRFIRR